MIESVASKALFRLNRQSAMPFHYQIKRMLLDQIAAGILSPGTRLPTEREYAEQLGVSLAPIRQALGELARQGYVERVKSRGTFVCKRKIDQKITALSSFTECLHQTGLPVSVEVLRLERCRPPKYIAIRLGLSGRDPVVALQRRCCVEREPTALLSSWLPSAMFPNLEAHSFTDRSLYQLLESEYACALTRAETYIEVGPVEDESSLLAVDPGMPLIRVESVAYDRRERAVEYVEMWYRADRYRFFIESRKEESDSIR
jgi:GntR family transcriptional regulator